MLEDDAEKTRLHALRDKLLEAGRTHWALAFSVPLHHLLEEGLQARKQYTVEHCYQVELRLRHLRDKLIPKVLLDTLRPGHPVRGAIAS